METFRPMAVLVSLLQFNSVHAAHPLVPNKPHLVHIVMDDVGHNDLGYVNDRVRTPTIDSLAHSGLKLDKFYAFKECAPSRGSILTGRYPYHFGYYRNPSDEGGVPLDFAMLPKILRDRAGYKTHAVGKWHVGFPTRAHTATFRGFESWIGYYHWGEEYFSHVFPPEYKGKVKCRGVDFSNNSGTDMRPFAKGSAVDGIYSMDVFVSETRRVIQAHPAFEPLYLYLAFQNVHDPYDVPQKYINGVDRRTTDATRRNFSGMVTALDDGIEAVLEELKGAGMYENSVILLTSDNGGELPFAADLGPGGGAGNNWPLRGGKFSLWEGGIRARAILHSPLLPATRQGATYHGLMHVSDIYPTFAALAGITFDSIAHTTGSYPLDGVDLSDALWGAPGATKRKEILHQPLGKHWDGSCTQGDLANPFRPSCGAAITRWPYKLIHGYAGDNRTLPLNDDDYHRRRPVADGSNWVAKIPGLALPPPGSLGSRLPPPSGAPCVAHPCLFDLAADESEQHDIAAEHQDIVAELTARLWEYGADGAEPQPAEANIPTWSDEQCAVVTSTGSWQPWHDNEEMIVNV
jgi:arylsulfatase B/arylsulfatase I/J